MGIEGLDLNASKKNIVKLIFGNSIIIRYIEEIVWIKRSSSILRNSQIYINQIANLLGY